MKFITFSKFAFTDFYFNSITFYLEILIGEFKYFFPSSYRLLEANKSESLLITKVKIWFDANKILNLRHKFDLLLYNIMQRIAKEIAQLYTIMRTLTATVNATSDKYVKP